MVDRFAVTGSGRCGTKYLAELLTAAGVRCGHERAYNEHGRDQWTWERQADSSWMAATYLPLDVPVVLLTRHPLAVVRSYVEIGFFSPVDAKNPTHGPLQRFAPSIYDHEAAADRALAMWIALNAEILPQAEMRVSLERLDLDALTGLLRWAGVATDRAGTAFKRTGRVNRHDVMRQKTRISHEPTWDAHDPELAERARDLARELGYDPDAVPQ